MGSEPSAAYKAIQNAITDQAERAKILDLGGQLGLSPSSPEWAILALNLAYTSRLAAAFARHEGTIQQLLVAAKGTFEVAATTSRQKLVDDLRPTVQTALSGATVAAVKAAADAAAGALKKAASDALANERDNFVIAANNFTDATHKSTWMQYLSGALAALVVVGSLVMWHFGYGAGWTDRANAGYIPVGRQVCAALENVRHNLVLAHRGNAVNSLRYEMTQRGCP
uniref:Uncharacterized protein n=1 Tax=mine drainage metagenome TaxID=410659 RepID=E6PCW1_9ZZZZ